ncbi:MAG TPA: hypothetical protein VN655_11305 [Pseudolabrys sp.]|nr:hypothetical protein [Pseudolabrys sp.]
MIHAFVCSFSARRGFGLGHRRQCEKFFRSEGAVEAEQVREARRHRSPKHRLSDEALLSHLQEREARRGFVREMSQFGEI